MPYNKRARRRREGQGTRRRREGGGLVSVEHVGVKLSQELK